MSERTTMAVAFVALTLVALAACGQKGPLYLPDAASEVVTRPAPSLPTDQAPSAPNSPQTVDDPTQAPAAPEVTAPVGTPEADDPKKEKGALPPPPK
jgi:predicted small lipoprotein YifL